MSPLASCFDVLLSPQVLPWYDVLLFGTVVVGLPAAILAFFYFYTQAFRL